MALPASFLRHVEQHGCFTGCYGSESDLSICLDAAQPLQPVLVIGCHDCFAKIAVPQALVPAGCTSYGLAREVTLHLRTQRGFAFSFGGYHAKGPGFWCSAVYYASCGLFLINGERSRALGSDLDLLLLAFRNGVHLPPDSRMLDPKQYVTQVAYVRYAAPLTPIVSRQNLLASSHCRLQASPGFQRVTLAEFQPVARAAAASASAPPAAPPAPKPLKIGDRCPVCGAEVRERSLFQGTFVGCLC